MFCSQAGPGTGAGCCGRSFPVFAFRSGGGDSAVADWPQTGRDNVNRQFTCVAVRLSAGRATATPAASRVQPPCPRFVAPSSIAAAGPAATQAAVQRAAESHLSNRPHGHRGCVFRTFSNSRSCGQGARVLPPHRFSNEGRQTADPHGQHRLHAADGLLDASGCVSPAAGGQPPAARAPGAMRPGHPGAAVRRPPVHHRTRRRATRTGHVLRGWGS